MKAKIGAIISAQNWFNYFFTFQLVAYMMLLIALLVFFPVTNPYFPTFAAALAVLSFSWLGVAIAWRKLIKIVSNI